MPQQPEIARSGRGATVPSSAKAKASTTLPASDVGAGPVPDDNLPGHHPEREQDKPNVRPLRQPRVRRKADATLTSLSGGTAVPPREPATIAAEPVTRFGFRFEPKMAGPAALACVTPYTSSIEVSGGRLRVRFGWWTLTTTVDNVESVEETGPYEFLKVVGPPRLSLRDRGITFATTTEGGVCVRFRRPVACLFPFGVLRHPAMTVTPDDPAAFAAALEPS